MADESGGKSEETNLPGIGELQAFSQQALRVLVGATQKANSLPSAGEDHDFYYSFSDFREFRNAQGTRLLNNAHDLLRHFHVQCGWPKRGQSCDSVDVDDLFENLVEANDILLEEVDTRLDEASGLSKNKNPVLNKSIQSNIPVVSSWNRRSVESGKKDSPVRLLLAKNITRPQMKFKDKIDNSNSPFVPILKSKPHALKPLQSYIPDTTVPEQLSVPSAIADFIHQQRITSSNTTHRVYHPYEYELQVFEPLEKQLKEEKEKLYNNLEETPCTYVKTMEQLEELNETLSNVTEFAVDLEHHSYRTFQGFVCLMQISTRDQDYLIDTLELRSELGMLNESFTNPEILKVLHGADMDIGWLQRDFGIYVVNMFDTGQASRVLNYERLSLSYLLKKFCDVSANKQYQLADWRIRPLPAEMSQYAREDTHYLLYIYDRLRNELIRNGNAQNNLLLSVYQRSKDICLKKYEKPLYTSESYLNLYTKQRRPLNPSQLQVFKALHEWRDTIARQEDESCGFVLPNHMLFNLAESLPREPQGVLACCNPVPTLVKQYVSEVHMIIQNAKDSLPSTNHKGELTAATTEQLQPTPSMPLAASRQINEVSMDASSRHHIAGHEKCAASVKPFEGYTPKGPKVKAAKPVISLFDYPETNSGIVSKGLEKAKRILAGFTNPFKSVLKSTEATAGLSTNENRPEQPQAKIDEINKNWKQKSNDAAKPSTSKDKSSASESEDEDDQEHTTPLRHQISVKQRKRKPKFKTEDSSSKKQKTKNNVDQNPSYEALSQKSTEFVPFDYSPGVSSKLEVEDKSQAKKDIFNPYERTNKQTKTKSPRSKVHLKSGERSMTWSKNRSSQGKQQWPSR